MRRPIKPEASGRVRGEVEDIDVATIQADVAGAPPLAEIVFANRLALARRYVSWLSGAGVVRGLVGPREIDRLWDRHVFNSAAVGALIAPGVTVVDIGSGAGLPGLVVAIARPDLRVVLVESMQRRAAFLEEVSTDLALTNVEVRRARAEELHSAGLSADVVTARAVAPLDRLAGWAGPLLRPGGELLALKGDRAVEELASAWPALRRAGFESRAELVSVVADAGVVEPSGSPGELAGLSVETERVVVADRSAAAAPNNAGSVTAAVGARLGLVVRLRLRAAGRPSSRPRGLR